MGTETTTADFDSGALTSLLVGERPFPTLASTDKPVKNSDGSTDLYFGAKESEQ